MPPTGWATCVLIEVAGCSQVRAKLCLANMSLRMGPGHNAGYAEEAAADIPWPLDNRSDFAFWVFIVLAILAGAVMYRAATTRGPSDTGYRSSDTPAQATPAPAKLAILGDPYSGSPGVGGVGPANWTELLAQSLSAPGKPVEVVVATQNSAGYVKPTGATGASLTQQVAQTVTADDRVVLVFPRPSDAA